MKKGFTPTPVLSRLREVFVSLPSICKCGKKEHNSTSIERRSFAGSKQVWGFGLIETIVASAVITVFFVALLTTYSLFLKTLLGGTRDVQATFLLREGAEVARVLRDTSWTSTVGSTSGGTSYYLSWSDVDSAWALTTTPRLVDGLFEQTLTFSPVYRDASDDIATAGTLDQNTRKVTVNVAWRNGTATTTKTLETYITNLYGN